MSMFLEPDEETLRVPDEQNYTISYPSTPSSLATSNEQDLFDAGNAWAAGCSSADESHCGAQPMAWPFENGLGFSSTQASTHHPMLVHPSLASFANTAMPSSWPTSAGILMPSTTHRENVRHDSLIQYCYPQSGVLPGQPTTTWNALPEDVASFRPAYEMSPGQSDYSVSSQTSGIAASSPYAHSDGCFQTRNSPLIKLEEDYNPPRPRIQSAAGRASPQKQHTHVNPGDVYYSPDVEADQQPITPHLAPVKVEEDVKPVLHPLESRGHAAMSMEDMRRGVAEDRQKRGYTTPINAVCSCHLCGKLFQRTSNLKAHMDTHRPNREQPFACNFYGCTRRFVRRTDMTRHQESVHIRSRNFHCMLCSRSFARKDTLRRHIDDGCPRRAEYKRHLTRDRRASSSRLSSHSQFSRDSSGDFGVPTKVEPLEHQ